MIITAISDLHGRLPSLPDTDLLLISGDICSLMSHNIVYQSYWLSGVFKPWLESLTAKKIVIIWGNHDLVAEKAPHMVPQLPCTVLLDNMCEFEGLKIYGTPYSLEFYDWAFNTNEEGLRYKFDKIPDDTDIVLSHGPPKGYGDLTNPQKDRPAENAGSLAFLDYIERKQPKLAVFGHIHEGRGHFKLNDSLLLNATVVNARYQMVHPPYVISYTDKMELQ